MRNTIKIIVISNYAVIREGIISTLSTRDDMSIEFVGETVKEAMFMIKGNLADIILLDINDGYEGELRQLCDIRCSGHKIKVIILDFNENTKTFIKAIRNKVDGYILGKSNKEEIVYVIEQIYNGKKYFDSYFIDGILYETF